jgi:hypothetical protein
MHRSIAGILPVLLEVALVIYEKVKLFTRVDIGVSKHKF